MCSLMKSLTSGSRDWQVAKGGTRVKHVRLNLFNHVLALFRAKFACNIEIRYPVFRWELCKGTV